MRERRQFIKGCSLSTAILVAGIGLSSPVTARTGSLPLRTWWDGTTHSNSQVVIALHRTPSDRPTISRSLPIKALLGLKPDQLDSPSPTAVAFRYNVEAGELSCTGSATGGRGTGQCEFYPSGSYAADLARLGVGPRDGLQQLRLGMAQVTVEYARAILNSGLQGADAEDLKRLRNHGIEPADVAAAPYKTADAIIHAHKKHGNWQRPYR